MTRGVPSFGQKKKTAFLRVVAAGWSVSKAADAVGICRATAYNYRRSDPEFAKAWDDALEAGADVLEDEGLRRAVEGIEKPVTVAGKREIVREYSDTLLIFKMKGARPEKYARFEVTGAKGDPIQVEHRGVSLAEILRVAASAGQGSDRAERGDD